MKIFNLRNHRPSGPDDVRVDRTTIYGNPYVLLREQDRMEVVRKYEVYIKRRMREDEAFARQVYALKGKNLFCWCAPRRCHAEVLRKVCQALP